MNKYVCKYLNLQLQQLLLLFFFLFTNLHLRGLLTIINNLLKLWEQEREAAIYWLKQNEIVVNSGKLQAFVVGTNKKIQKKSTLNTYKARLKLNHQ